MSMPDGTVSAVGQELGWAISHEVNKFSNSKILLLDPIKGSFTQENRVLIRSTLFENVSDRLFTESLLERGGIRIVFKTLKLKEIEERILRENLKIFKPLKGPGGWLERPQDFRLWSKESLARPQFEIFWKMPASRM